MITKWWSVVEREVVERTSGKTLGLLAQRLEVIAMKHKSGGQVFWPRRWPRRLECSKERGLHLLDEADATKIWNDYAESSTKLPNISLNISAFGFFLSIRILAKL